MQMHIFDLLLVTMVTVVHTQMAAAELFTAIHDLKMLYLAERSVVADLLVYVEHQEAQIRQIKQKMTTFASRPRHGQDSVLDFIGHPVNAFHLIKEWWNPLENIPPGMEGAAATLTSEGMAVPTEVDYRGALLALLRLQDVYNISVSDMAEGVINGVKSEKPLAEFDMWMLGLYASEEKNYELALPWLQQVVAAAALDVPLRDASMLLAQAYHENQLKSSLYNKTGSSLQQGNVDQAVETIKELQHRNPDNKTVQAEVDFFICEQNKSLAVGHTDSPHENIPEEHKLRIAQWQDSWRNYKSLCNGCQYKPDDTNICRYKVGKIPYVVYKQEIVSADPFITVFYDVITDKQINILKKEASKDQFQRATVNRGDVTKSRISKLNWVMDENKEVKMISRKITDMTGLSTTLRNNVSHAEPYQVVNYGIGGQYEPHTDHGMFRGNQTNQPLCFQHSGDRIATFMFYLEATIAGGATVFPKVGIRIAPVKGAAAFWYNIKRSGEYDNRTLHAGCPVLLGQKWVANKWIRENRQATLHKCCLIEDVTELEAEKTCY